MARVVINGSEHNFVIARDAAIHRVSEDASRFCLFACWFTVDRHGLRPRDDKVGGRNVVNSIVTTRSLSLGGRSEVRDAAIHVVLRGGGRVCLFAYWFTVI